MLGNCSCIAVSDSCNCIRVCIVAECRNLVVLGPCIEHCHAHAIIIGDNQINLIAEGRRPCTDRISGCSSIPCCTGRVLHFLRSELSDLECLAAGINSAILYNCGRAICICAARFRVQIIAVFDTCAKSLADTPCTGNGVIVSDITNCQNIADDAIAISVNFIRMLCDVISNHLALQLSTLLGIEANIVSVLVPVQSSHVKLTSGAVGRLTVEPADRLVSVGTGRLAAGICS